MARGKSKGTPSNFKFSGHPGHGSAGKTAEGAKGSFSKISKRSPGGVTKSHSPSS